MSFIAIEIDNFEKGNQDKQESDSCRVCMESSEETSQLIKPCNCKGSVEFIHFHCLKEWIDHSHDDNVCGICKTKYYGLVRTGSSAPDATALVDAIVVGLSLTIPIFFVVAFVVHLIWQFFAYLNADFGLEAERLVIMIFVIVVEGYLIEIHLYYEGLKNGKVCGFDDRITRTCIQKQINQKLRFPSKNCEKTSVMKTTTFLLQTND